MFEPGYLNYLANEYTDLFASKEELYRIVFGNYFVWDIFSFMNIYCMKDEIGSFCFTN